MRRALLFVSITALSCARGCGSSRPQAPTASPAVLDASETREIEEATGTASPYVRELEAVRGVETDARPRPWPPERDEDEDEGIDRGDRAEARTPRRAPPREFTEEPPPEEREVPLDVPDAGPRGILPEEGSEPDEPEPTPPLEPEPDEPPEPEEMPEPEPEPEGPLMQDDAGVAPMPEVPDHDAG